MANKESNGQMTTVGPAVDFGGRSVLFIAGVFLLGASMYRSGYRSGIHVSQTMLRRHDKDVRRMEKKAAKREKQLKKDLSPKPEKRWPWQQTQSP